MEALESQSLLIRSLSPTNSECQELIRKKVESQSLLIRSLSPTSNNSRKGRKSVPYVAIPSYQVTFSDESRRGEKEAGFGEVAIPSYQVTFSDKGWIIRACLRLP